MNQATNHWNVIDELPIGVFYTDKAGDWSYVNKRWCEIITTCEIGDYTSRFFGRPHRNMPRLRNSLQIRVRTFLYTDPQRGEKIEVPLRVLSGISPFRMQVLADGVVCPLFWSMCYESISHVFSLS